MEWTLTQVFDAKGECHGQEMDVSLSLAFAGAGQAVAQDREEQQGVYVGGGLGDFSSEIDEFDGDDINFDESDTAYKLFVGYRFNQFFGAQFDYLDLGSSDSPVGAQNLEVETGGYAVRFEGTLPLAFFELFATAGLVFSDVEAESWRHRDL